MVSWSAMFEPSLMMPVMIIAPMPTATATMKSSTRVAPTPSRDPPGLSRATSGEATTATIEAVISGMTITWARETR